MAEMSRENYLRVTNVLYPFTDLHKIDAGVLARAADRGTRVHKICEAIMTGLGDFGTEEDVKGYVESFKKWWGEGKDVVEIEKRFWCDTHAITGQVDFIMNTDEGLAIVDIKTSSKPSKTWPIQGSAYYYLARLGGFDIQKIFFLHLKKDGKEPNLISYTPDESFFSAS